MRDDASAVAALGSSFAASFQRSPRPPPDAGILGFRAAWLAEGRASVMWELWWRQAGA